MATDSLHWDRVWGRARLLGEGFDKARVAPFLHRPTTATKASFSLLAELPRLPSLIQPPGWANAAHWASSAVAVHWPTRAATADLPLVRYWNVPGNLCDLQYLFKLLLYLFNCIAHLLS